MEFELEDIKILIENYGEDTTLMEVYDDLMMYDYDEVENELNMDLSEEQVGLFIKSLVNDNTISNYEWGKKYQHLRDDLSEGVMSLNDLHLFHKNRHNIDVINLAKKYGVIRSD